MASQGLSHLLATAITRFRTTQDERGNPRPDRPVSAANPFWGAPRIHGELLKLGVDISQATWEVSAATPQDPLPDFAQLSAQPPG
jgi:hypothetical protein